MFIKGLQPAAAAGDLPRHLPFTAMRNCALGATPGVRNWQCQSATTKSTKFPSRSSPFIVRSIVATAAAADSTTAQDSAAVSVHATEEQAGTPEADIVPPVHAATSTQAPSRRRRRATAAAAGSSGRPEDTSKQQGQQQKQNRTYPIKADLQQLFQQVPSSVKRVSRKQPAVLPAGAEQDAVKVVQANKQVAAKAKAKAKAQEQLQQIDPQLLAGFQPYARSFQVAAGSALPLGRPSPTKAQEQGADEAAAPATKQQQQQHQPSLPQQQPTQRSSRSTKRDFIELFSTKAAPGHPSPQVVRVGKDTAPAPLPEESKAATQKLAFLLAAQQQRMRQRQQQQKHADTGDAVAGDDAAAAASAADAKLLGARAQAPGLTRIYLPAPAKAAATSEAERQPLQVLSLRQQQHMREEARRAAVQKLREKNVRDYEAIVQQMLEWQGSSTRFYLPGSPAHFPVVVQRAWADVQHSTSSPAVDVAGSQAAPAAAAAQQLSQQEQQVLERVGSVVQQELGYGLPDRALRGERSFLLASLAPQAVRERLTRWVGCCGKDYVSQLMTKEPTLLGHEPQVLLATLEAVSSEMQLLPQDCVALVLKQPALIGLDRSELRQRLRGLSEAVGCEVSGAARLAAASSALLMQHPDYVKERMSALAKLLPEAAGRLPRLVVRHPYLLTKSPRAVARNILQMSDTLELSAWATCRLVAGLPSLLNSNYDTIRNRLDRLQQLAGPVQRWNRELQAMSPPALARCLSCSDTAISRLQQLVDIGAAGLARLPPINKILTQPAQWWEVSFEALAASREKAAERQATAAAAGVRGAEEGVDAAAIDAAPSSTQAAARAAAKAALAKVRRTGAAAAGASVAGSTQSLDDDGIMEQEADGLLGGDVSWRSSLTDALLGAASDMRARWLGGQQEPGSGLAGQQASQHSADGDAAPAAAAGGGGGGGSKWRRRR